MSASASPFRIEVPGEALDDLAERLRRTRFGAPSDERSWAAGADPGYLRELVASWATFDWRTQEAALNERPHFIAEIDGRRLHYVHVRAVGAPADRPALPLILSHGWPSSFVEMLPLADRLSDPARFGGDPAEAFDVVIPSLPGFLFSDPLPGPATRVGFARVLHALMTEVLGYRSYGAFGGDIGGATSAWLGALNPDKVVGVHLIHPPFPGSFDSPPT